MTLSPTREYVSRSQIKSSHRGYIRLPGVPDVEIEAYVLPDLARHSLLSLGVLCDAGLTAQLDHGSIENFHQTRLVMVGVRNSSTGGLWMIELATTQHVAMNIYPTGTIANLVAFYHGCFCSPSISTFEKVLALGTRLPGITERDIDSSPISTPPSHPLSAAIHFIHYQHPSV